MRVQSQNPYTVAYINNNSLKNELDNVNKSKVLNSTKLDAELKDLATDKFNKPEKIITKRERNFFKEMFPDSSMQIEKHILFNRNGRLQSMNLQKGSIVDGTV